jgi:hypothetical protein
LWLDKFWESNEFFSGGDKIIRLDGLLAVIKGESIDEQ